MYLVILCWLTPIIGFLLSPLIKKYKKYAYAQPIFTLISAVISVYLLFKVLRVGTIHYTLSWIPSLNFNIGFLVDTLSGIMINVVSWISLLIFIYSTKYMEHEPDIHRFWAMMNLFVGSMLLLVLSDNFLQMFFGWEMVGVTSYALIGHYLSDEREYWVREYPPTHCAIKAFITTKLGDVLMLIGIFLIYSSAGTLNYLQLAKNLNWVHNLASRGLLLVALLCFLAGPLGKSAQFPLHEWLPEAMAGPTPVSALIHAATMVKAGVYILARVTPLFHYILWSLNYSQVAIFFYVVALIGSFTTFLAASQGMVAKELKRILAYSTISQIGYMMLAIGVAGLLRNYVVALAAAVYHLISHAIFKALLFLSAGAVIHEARSKIIFDMGGMRKYMKITFFSMTLGALSLSGIPPLSGFWSKDLILLVTSQVHDPLLFSFALVTVALTVFYSFRMLGVVFFGKESPHLESIKEKYGIHEVNAVMWVPYLILAIATLVIGLLNPIIQPSLCELIGKNALTQTLCSKNIASSNRVCLSIGFINTSLGEEHILVPCLSVVFIIIGALPAIRYYMLHKGNVEELIKKHSILRGLYTFLWNRWYINSFYYLIVNVVLKLSSKLFKYLEQLLFEGINIGTVITFKQLSGIARKLVTGYVNLNILEMVVGLIILLIIVAVCFL